MRLLQCLSKAFLNLLILSALTTSSGRLFQLFMTRSEKMFCLCTLFADGFCNFFECPLVAVSGGARWKSLAGSIQILHVRIW